MFDWLKNTFKVEKSSTRGIVKDINDPKSKNRIKVYIPTQKDILNTYTGTWCTCGLLTAPAEGDVVIITYDNDDARVPMITANITQAMSFDPNSYASGGSTTVSGSSLISLIQEILKENEGDYDTVLANDNGAVSVGLLGWHENNARDDIFAKIKETCQSDFDKGGSSFRSLDKSWQGYIPNSTEVAAMKLVIDSDTGHTVQDNIIISYIESYLADAVECGITDAKCQMYYCDFANQASNDAKKCAKWCGSANLSDLDKFHNKVLSGSGWPAETTANRNRRTRTYNHILEFETSGQLTTALATENSSGELLWPFPGYPVVAYGFGNKTPSYGRWHPGIDINNTGNTKGTDTCKNQPVVACCDGSVIFGSDSYGNWAHIQKTGTEMHCYYFHLDHFATGFSAGKTTTVKTGQIIGYAGQTGYATGPHLHFEIRNGGTNSGSRTESDHGYLVDPELYLSADSSGSSNVAQMSNSNITEYKVIQNKENCPYLAETDYSKCSLNELIPFVYHNRIVDEREVPTSYTDVSLSSNYKPPLISDPDSEKLNPNILLQPIVWEKFYKMKSEAPDQYDQYFKIKNGYRSYENQMKKYQRCLSNNSQKARTATAGHSEHQLGLALDLYSDKYSDWLDLTAFYNWLLANAHKYGFVIRYPQGKDDITGYKVKPYHLRYVGESIATAVYNGGTYLALEEILKTK